MKILRRPVKAVFVITSLIIVATLLAAYCSTFISPVNFPLAAFFGLAYPVFFWLNISVLVFWALKRSRWFWPVFIVLLLGAPIHLRVFQLNVFNTKPKSERYLKVMSYNVQLFNWYNWRDNIKLRNQMFNQLNTNEADIFCFQEFFHSTEGNRFITRDTLVQFLEAKHVHDAYTHEMYEVQFYGIATFSKYPFINKGIIEFPNDKNNICIWSDIVVEGDTMRIYNAHLCSVRLSEDDYQFIDDINEKPGVFEKSKAGIIYRRLKSAYVKRAWQSQLVKDHMQKCPYPIIFCGDFNDTPVSYTYSVFNGFLNDAFRNGGSGMGTTHIGNIPFLRIDYIFTSPGLVTTDYQRLPEELSDHHAIQCKVWY